ncbi:hypothetical protein [Plantactinospora sp. B24E8]|uniref:acyltransferase n=1 Tax=Plantactinospora sp. B24E8 TaxID=3153567 RepID=UPI00325F444C
MLIRHLHPRWREFERDRCLRVVQAGCTLPGDVFDPVGRAGVLDASTRARQGEPAMMHLSTPDVPITVTDLIRAGLLELGDGCQIHPSAVFLPADMLGTIRPIALGDRVAVGAFTVVHGGTSIGRDTRIGHRATVGEPEYGYAVRRVYQGAGAPTTIGSGVVLRAGATVYAGASVLSQF